MTYASTILEDEPLRWYRLGEASGTVATDSSDPSGNGLNGTYVNAPTLGVTGAIGNDSNTGVTVARASSQHITIPATGLPSGASPYTIECRFKPSVVDANQMMVGWGNAVDNQKNVLSLKTSGGNGILNSWHNNDLSALATISTTEYQQIVATWDGTTHKIYHNALEVGSRVPVTPPSVATTSPAIGKNASLYADGSLDEFIIYDYALPPERIQAHYISGSVAVADSGLANEAKLNFLKMIVGKAPTPYVQPLEIKLITSVSDAAIPGLVCTGEEYADQPVIWAEPSGSSLVNNAASVDFAPLDETGAFDIYGYEVWDSGADDQRITFEVFSSPFTVAADTPTSFDQASVAIIVNDTNDTLTNTAEQEILSWVTGGSASVPFAVPLQIRLMVANGGESSGGTECTGDLYDPQNIYWTDPQLSNATPSAYATATNSAPIVFPALSSTVSTNVTGYEIWDTSGTPKRIAYQNYGSPTAVAANTNATFATSALELRVI